MKVMPTASTSMAPGLRLLDDLRADLVYIARTVRRSPGFAVVAIVSMALGVGANTLVFSVVNALVLRPLPVERPEEVVFVQNANREFPSQSFPNYRDLRDRNDTFAGLIGYRISPMSVASGDAASRVWGISRPVITSTCSASRLLWAASSTRRTTRAQGPAHSRC